MTPLLVGSRAVSRHDGWRVALSAGRATTTTLRTGFAMGEQLSFGEVTASQRHELVGSRQTALGYVADCACGWSSAPAPYPEYALRRYREHLARTPAGSRLVSILQKPGRFTI